MLSALLQSAIALVLFVQAHPELSETTRASALASAQRSVGEVARVIQSGNVLASQRVTIDRVQLEKVAAPDVRSMAVSGTATQNAPLRIVAISPRFTGETTQAAAAKFRDGHVDGFYIARTTVSPVVPSGYWGTSVQIRPGLFTIFMFDERDGSLIMKSDAATGD